MNPSFFLDLLAYALPSGFLSGVVTWLVSRRKRRNDLLSDMQQSIDLLCEKYNEVLQQNVALRQEKADWQVLQQELLLKIDRLTRDVATLRKNLTTKKNETAKIEKTPRRASLRTVGDIGVQRHEKEPANVGTGDGDRATELDRLAIR